MVTEARKRANVKYAKANYKQVKFSLNINYDADIIERLEKCDNVAGYFKEMIRADIEARPDLFD